MKTIPFLLFAALLSGCSLLTQSPSEAKAHSAEAGRESLAKRAAINARVESYEKQGLSSREARALADAEYAKSGAGNK